MAAAERGSASVYGCTLESQMGVRLRNERHQQPRCTGLGMDRNITLDGGEGGLGPAYSSCAVHARPATSGTCTVRRYTASVVYAALLVGVNGLSVAGTGWCRIGPQGCRYYAPTPTPTQPGSAARAVTCWYIGRLWRSEQQQKKAEGGAGLAGSRHLAAAALQWLQRQSTPGQWPSRSRGCLPSMSLPASVRLAVARLDLGLLI